MKYGNPVLPPGSRLAWVSEDLRRQNQSHASYQQYENTDRVWKLLEEMEKIGAEHGINRLRLYCVSFIFNYKESGDEQE